MLYLYQAIEIVQMFFDDMNPKRWNGKGDPPDDFDNRMWEYVDEDGDIPEKIWIGMQFYLNDDGEWDTYISFMDVNCEIVGGVVDTVSDSELIAYAVRSLSYDLDELLKKGRVIT